MVKIVYSNLDLPLEEEEGAGTPAPSEARERPSAGESTGPRPTKGVLKVSRTSRPNSVAGAIAGVIREKGRVEVQAIGANATNQAIKAVAVARKYLEEDGLEIVCVPEFIDVEVAGQIRTAIRLVVTSPNWEGPVQRRSPEVQDEGTEGDA